MLHTPFFFRGRAAARLPRPARALLPALLLAAGAAPLHDAQGQAVRMRVPDDTLSSASLSVAAATRASWHEGGRAASGPAWRRMSADVGATASARALDGRVGLWATTALTTTDEGDAAPRWTSALGARLRRGGLAATLAIGQDVAYGARLLGGAAGGDTLSAARRDSIARGIQRPVSLEDASSAGGDATSAATTGSGVVRVAAAVAGLEWNTRRFGARLYYGLQVGGGRTARPWGGADLDVPLGPLASLLVGAERRATRVVDGGTPRQHDAMAAHLGVRLAVVPWAKRDRERGADPGPLGERRRLSLAGAPFAVESAADGIRLRVRSPGARRAEIAGDLTDWQPTAMRPAGEGWWEVTLDGAPGLHRVRLRIDGGAWGPPPSLPVVRDDYGETVGVFVAP